MTAKNRRQWIRTFVSAMAFCLFPLALHLPGGSARAADDNSFHRCHETRIEHYTAAGDLDPGQSEETRCHPHPQPLAPNYVMQDDKIYYALDYMTNNDTGCISGTGDTTALFSNLSLGCLFPKVKKMLAIEVRKRWLIGPYTPAFRRYTETRPHLADWQQKQIEPYVTDGQYVYRYHTRLKGAVPDSFSTWFPFGNDEKWERFKFARSGNLMFMDGHPLPDIPLEKTTWLEPVRCPGHDLVCTWAYALDCDHDAWGCRGLLGRLDDDLVYLQWDRLTVFEGMASPDLFMFMTSKIMYFFSNGRFYEIVPGHYGAPPSIQPMDKTRYTQDR